MLGVFSLDGSLVNLYKDINEFKKAKQQFKLTQEMELDEVGEFLLYSVNDLCHLQQIMREIQKEHLGS